MLQNCFSALVILKKKNSRYAYRDGVLTLEAAPCKVRTGIIASIQSQLDIRGAFGTESALWPRVYPNLGTTLSPRTGYVFRIPDVHIGIESMWNLSHEYDSRLRKYIVVDIDTSNETSNSLRLVDEWFEGGEDIMQVILVHIDKEEAYQITHALNVAANPTQPMTSENIGAKDCGTIWRWGRGSHGHKALIEEIVSAPPFMINTFLIRISFRKSCSTKRTTTQTFHSHLSTLR